MQADGKSPHPEDWVGFRQWYEHALSCNPLFAVPIRVIDWAIARGVTNWLIISRSHDFLIISTRWWRATNRDTLAVVPLPESIELHVYRNRVPDDVVVVNDDQLVPELDRIIATFRQHHGT